MIIYIHQSHFYIHETKAQKKICIFEIQKHNNFQEDFTRNMHIIFLYKDLLGHAKNQEILPWFFSETMHKKPNTFEIYIELFSSYK